MLSDEAYSIVR